ncbi:hypothetical protein PHAMO_370005 [Magnetospirillum molischianum DSM 120]|uniref:Uncharacterized protein n=1 Tax=Magnetospirillum molischianum DSM 120 TaxID=1150626 RepID=H8FVD5_MAGML|nr:hypothetical protein PHAMO_370005 [Magnetospirillum molischianum DSM 120]
MTMGRKYKGDTTRDDDREATEVHIEVEGTSCQGPRRPMGIDPETFRRAQDVALRQIQARIATFY